METTAAHFAQIVEVESRSVSGMMGTYISELVARGGIEPPTRGFSVRLGSRPPSGGQLQLPQKRLVARIAGEPAQKSVAFDVHQTAVALGMGALEPLEG